jgi:hypothetical protein
MKTLWSILSIVAVAHLLAIAGIIAYLVGTGRLDAPRMREVRQLMSETSTQRDARLEQDKIKAARDAAAAQSAAKIGTPPVTAADALDLKLEQSQIDLTRLESLKRDVQVLQETLARERAALDTERSAFTKARQDFEQAREVVRKTESDAQFKKALATIEGLKADKAKATLQTLIEQQQTDQVVSYLNAMQERTRTKVLDEFIKSDPKVAADLLERLRTRGMSVAGLGASP